MSITTSEFIAECAYVWQELYKEADQGPEEVLWEGSITKWFQDRNIGTDKYSRIVQALKAMQCMEVITQGNRYTATIVKLHHPPTVELWVKANTSGLLSRRGSKKTDVLNQSISSLQERITKLEAKVDMLMDEKLAHAETS